MSPRKPPQKPPQKPPSKSAPTEDNRRKHPRVELLAAVGVRQANDGENYVLPARNISLGGIYLDADGLSLEQFTAGVIVEISLFDGTSDSLPPLRTTARVARVEAAGMALSWATSDAKVALALAQILDKLTPATPPEE